MVKVKPNTFKKGDIVYWCHNAGNGRYSVHYGMVDEQFSDAIYIDYLEPRERRLINGVPLDDFKDEKYHKLPKGWSYDTELFTIDYEPMDDNEKNTLVDFTDPLSVKSAYDNGYLTESSKIFHGQVEAEITKEGYRVRKVYPAWKHHFDYTSVMPHKVYFTYGEAKKEVDENIAEFNRQASLSDYDWSVEQIDKTLAHYKRISDVSEKEIQKLKDFLLSQNNVEDIETRISGGEVQWKYWKNKRWVNIES